MRTLTLQVQVTIDGCMGGPNGEIDFMTSQWDDALHRHVEAVTASVGTIVLGRKLALGVHSALGWRGRGPRAQVACLALKFHATPKVVFSRTLTSSPWANATVTNGDLVQEIGALKAQPGGDIMAYGGATFVSGLVRHSLVDEYHLYLNPAALGRGLPVFPELEQVKRFRLRRQSSGEFASLGN
jgi:dihydrofolate reductase